jgi:hypothetical protein
MTIAANASPSSRIPLGALIPMNVTQFLSSAQRITTAPLDNVFVLAVPPGARRPSLVLLSLLAV